MLVLLLVSHVRFASEAFANPTGDDGDETTSYFVAEYDFATNPVLDFLNDITFTSYF